MTNLFSNPYAKRRTVVVVLLVWLFALSAAWVNTCLLQERGAHIDQQSAQSLRAI